MKKNRRLNQKILYKNCKKKENSEIKIPNFLDFVSDYLYY